MINRFCIILTGLLAWSAQCAAQKVDMQEVERLRKMAESLKGVDKATMLKNRDSVMKSIKAITQKKDSLAAKTLDANAPQTKAENKILLNDIMSRRYDTTYTIVDFECRYKRKDLYTTIENYVSGTTDSAVVIRSSTSQYIHVESKNPVVEAALKQQLQLRVINDTYKKNYQSLEADGGYTKKFKLGDHTVKESGSTISEKIPAAFSFTVDELQKITTAAAGAGIMVKGEEKLYMGDDQPPYDTVREAGGGAASDLADVKISGATHLKSDSTKPILHVTKTKAGYRVSYRFTYKDGDGTPENTATITENFTAYIGEHLPKYEAVITPVETKDYQYKKWIPVGPKVDGSNDNKGNKSNRFKIVVRDKTDPTKIYPGKFTVAWSLDKVTNYKGICNNYPPQKDNPNTENDWRFDQDMKTDANFDPATVNNDEAASVQNKGNDAIVTLECMDYAAWGQLLATVTLDDGTAQLNAVAFYDTKVKHLTLPYDADENKIADAWEDSLHIGKKGYALTWDADNQPSGQRENGDGYTLLEEYRGFAVTDAAESGNSYQHICTDPLKKDGFVYDLDQLFSKYYDEDRGNGGTHNPAQIVWHYLSAHKNQLQYDANAPDADLNRWVNFNSEDDYAIAPQYAIVLAFSQQKYTYDKEMTAVSFTKSEWQVAQWCVAHPDEDPNNMPAALYKAYTEENNETVPYINPMKKHIKIEILKPAIIAKCAFIKAASGDVAFNLAVDILIGNAVRHEVGHCLGIPHHQPNAYCGAEGCVMRYETHAQRKDPNFLAIVRDYYCNKGESGPMYIIIEPGKETQHEVSAGSNSSDDCYKKITIKTSKE